MKHIRLKNGEYITLSDNELFVLENCTNENGKNLICAFPEQCNCCIYGEVKGTKDIQKAYELYKKWQDEVNECIKS